MKTEANPSYRILVVDDELTVRRATTMLLKYDGHIAETLESGEAALEIFKPGKFDLVITDNFMGGMSGGQLTALIKKRHPDQLVIMATASADQLEMADAMAAGVDLILNKPFTRHELNEAIAQVASRKMSKLGADPSFCVVLAAAKNSVDRART